jgi:hypothetical protein
MGTSVPSYFKMTTYFSKITYPNVSGDSEFSIPFEYLEQSHINVTLDDVAQVNGTDYSINESTSKVVFSGGTGAGEEVAIIRDTPIATDELAVTFSDGSGLNATDLNASTKQNIFAIQEQDDSIVESIAIVSTALLGSNNLSDVDSSTTSRTNLDVYSKAETDSLFADATGALMISNNLSDVESASDSRDNLGLGTIATQDADSVAITGGSIAGITDLAITDGGTGASSKTVAFDNLAPTTTKGDIIVSNGSDNIRVGVGADDYVLVADAAETSGVKWAAAGGGISEYFQGYTGTSPGAPSDATWTKVPIETEEFDNNSTYDATTNYRYTPTSSGYYRIYGTVVVTYTTDATKYLYAAIYKNGAAYKQISLNASTPTTERSLRVNIDTVVNMNGTTDYVELYGYSSGSGISDWGANSVYGCQFGGFKLNTA